MMIASRASAWVMGWGEIESGRHVGKHLLVLGVLEDTLSLEPSPCLLESPSLNAAETISSDQSDHSSSLHKPGIRLVSVAQNAKSQAAKETPVENLLPALVLVLLAGLDAKQDATGRVEVVVV